MIGGFKCFIDIISPRGFVHASYLGTEYAKSEARNGPQLLCSMFDIVLFLGLNLLYGTMYCIHVIVIIAELCSHRY